MDDIQKIIDILGLTPLSQEGGLFRSSYRSPGKVDGRDMGSAIYFMLSSPGRGTPTCTGCAPTRCTTSTAAIRWSFWNCCPTAPAG